MFVISAVLVVLAYVLRFGNYGLSNSTESWSSFASYFSGMLSPILAFVNILILVSVRHAIYDTRDDIKAHRKKLKRYNHNKDFKDLKVQINPYATAEDNINQIESNLNAIEHLFEGVQESDERCEQDLYQLARKAKLNRGAISALKRVNYYENPFINRNWEFHNLAVTNTMVHTRTSFLQLKVNVYSLMVQNNPNDKSLYEKFKKAQKDLEEFHKDSGVVV